MSDDAEKVKRLVTFRTALEKRVENLESELKDLQTMLEVLDSILLQKGFRRPEIGKQPAQPRTMPQEVEATAETEPSTFLPSTEPETTVALTAASGDLLATLYVGSDSLRVVPAEDKAFNVDMPPFMQFLVERVLAKMQERDNELARTGRISHDRIFSYSILQDGNIFHEMVIKNIDSDRIRELKSSIRWTLEKMYEKMRS